MSQLLKKMILMCVGVHSFIFYSHLNGQTSNPVSKINIRINQLGYLLREPKVATLFSDKNLKQKATVVETGSKKIIFSVIPQKMSKTWGRFDFFYEFDFSTVQQAGEYFIRIGTDSSASFSISDHIYQEIPDLLLEYMRQQRCGFNPFWDEVCHQLDGRTMYAPLPDSTYIDVNGGWHDAGDDLKYLLTSSYATGVMLLSYRIQPPIFKDLTNGLGQSLPNGIPDILDEARWGLDWLLKMHPQPDQLYHQVADDRDHTGWKYPFRDSSDYGWGRGSYRVAYFADGKPQGLNRYQSASDGIANLAGRCAAALTMAADIWKNDLGDLNFAERCLQAAREIYELGKRNEGVQQGNSYGAPYRYAESTWADDMEWGAAELYRVTADGSYLQDALKYSRMIQSISWMGQDSSAHYQFYPFLNLGHYSLFSLVSGENRHLLSSYYRDGIEKCREKGESNPFRIGVPFIWCSNNLVTALVSQCLLYQKMNGDVQYVRFMTEQRDWLLGRNPWGTSMLVGIPAGGEFPQHPHASTYVLTGLQITGGLVDGPVYRSIFNNLKGLFLSKPDEFADFQGEIVYHDDLADYSTNEPTMDGTAAAILAFTLSHIIP
ncbi:MAG: glycoside hydrolase family 9 [Caldithrix sp. RBG_13_44_9]|nr:MAG: glycoside hydrolase family 9 [Caldithrix sp. RBG_13_44_9]